MLSYHAAVLDGRICDQDQPSLEHKVVDGRQEENRMLVRPVAMLVTQPSLKDWDDALARSVDF